MKNQKGLGLVEILIIILILGAAGVGGYYVWQKNDSDKSTKSSSKEQSGASDKSSQSSSPASVVKETALSAIELTYSPENRFSASEKSELKKKLIEPLVDHGEMAKGTQSYNPVLSIMITKDTDAEYASDPSYAKFRYSVDANYKNGVKAGFSYGENDIIDWWLPECFDGQCGLSSAFKEKYPEIVSRLSAAGNTP